MNWQKTPDLEPGNGGLVSVQLCGYEEIRLTIRSTNSGEANSLLRG